MDIPLTLQTAYAELLERASAADFETAFAETGTFVSKEIKGRRYWYFQTLTEGHKRQRYVGPETPEILERIALARQSVDDLRERRTLVSTLLRSAFLPQPSDEIGRVVAALSAAGVFRLRAVLVGTVAFQTYSAMLGTRLPNAAVLTDDVDIAQDRNISIAVEDRTEPIGEILKGADSTFRSVPTLHDGATFSYKSRKLRVDILTPNRGPDSDTPVKLKALGTDAQQLRFLDFLIRDPEPAVLLHGGGVFVNVPAPERYALHKLIVAERRMKGTGKSEKDLRQAGSLIAVLVKRRQTALRDAWDEAVSRGTKWRALMLAGLASINADVRDNFLKLADEMRSVIANIDMRFEDAPARYDNVRAAIVFRGVSMNAPITFAVSREALADHFNLEKDDNRSRVEAFNRHRAEIEAMAREKYLNWPVDDPAITILTSANVAKLKSAVAARKRK